MFNLTSTIHFKLYKTSEIIKSLNELVQKHLFPCLTATCTYKRQNKNETHNLNKMIPYLLHQVEPSVHSVSLCTRQSLLSSWNHTCFLKKKTFISDKPKITVDHKV